MLILSGMLKFGSLNNGLRDLKLLIYKIVIKVIIINKYLELY